MNMMIKGGLAYIHLWNFPALWHPESFFTTVPFTVGERQDLCSRSGSPAGQGNCERRGQERRTRLIHPQLLRQVSFRKKQQMEVEDVEIDFLTTIYICVHLKTSVYDSLTLVGHLRYVTSLPVLLLFPATWKSSYGQY